MPLWSPQEREEFERGIQKHGIGKWKQILDDESFKFHPERKAKALSDRYHYLKKQPQIKQTRPIQKKARKAPSYPSSAPALPTSVDVVVPKDNEAVPLPLTWTTSWSDRGTQQCSPQRNVKRLNMHQSAPSPAPAHTSISGWDQVNFLYPSVHRAPGGITSRRGSPAFEMNVESPLGVERSNPGSLSLAYPSDLIPDREPPESPPVQRSTSDNFMPYNVSTSRSAAFLQHHHGWQPASGSESFTCNRNGYPRGPIPTSFQMPGGSHPFYDSTSEPEFKVDDQTFGQYVRDSQED